MLNIGVLCDINWDNYILINNKFKKLNSEIYRIHSIYGKSLEIIDICSNKNNLTLIRHFSETLSNTVYNLLNICDIWIVFSNNIEYNTLPRLILDKCDEHSIKYINVSEYSRNKDFYSFDIDIKLSFKKIINSINKKDDIKITKFNNEVYNDNFMSKSLLPIQITNEIKQKIKDSYKTINDNKKNRSIKLLYDKDELKLDKELKKTVKSLNQITYTTNKQNYYKKIK